MLAADICMKPLTCFSIAFTCERSRQHTLGIALQAYTVSTNALCDALRPPSPGQKENMKHFFVENLIPIFLLISFGSIKKMQRYVSAVPTKP